MLANRLDADDPCMSSQMNGMDDLFVEVDIGEGVEAVKFGSPDEFLSESWQLLLWAASSSDEVNFFSLIFSSFAFRVTVVGSV